MSDQIIFSAGDEVTVRTYDWQAGELEFAARIVRPTSPSHVMVRVDGLLFVVPAEDCTLVTAQRQEAA